MPEPQQQTSLTPALSVQPESYARSPTLLAGATTGEHGEVRVWSPNKRTLRQRVAYICGSAALWVILFHYIFHTDLSDLIGHALAALIMLPFYLVPYWRASKRPCYLTTDDNGVGITTWEGSRAFRWADILAIKWVKESLFTMDVIGQQPDGKSEIMKINLGGYPKTVKCEFLSLVMKKAQLKPDSKNKFPSLYPTGSRRVEAPLALPTPTCRV